MDIDINFYAKSDEEAKEKSITFKNFDPYPKIQPALLNSADIAAYVKATSLIYPFQEDRLKGASYDVPIKGKVVYWKYLDTGEVRKKELELTKAGDYFNLEPNSIAFVTLEPTFRIPYYLALRFNLKISHIYKGLLLGTGPLVDPGFNGKLSIPLHNLTANTYRFFCGDELITMEFTKLSPNNAWLSVENEINCEHLEKYKQNNITSNRNVNDYIAKALKHDHLGTVISSIPDAVNDCKTEVKKANKTVKELKKEATIQVIGSMISIVVAFVSMFVISFDAVNKANERYDQLYEKFMDMQTNYEMEYNDLKDEIDRLNENHNGDISLNDSQAGILAEDSVK